jgi:hypothetical protein
MPNVPGLRRFRRFPSEKAIFFASGPKPIHGWNRGIGNSAGRFLRRNGTGQPYRIEKM